jgi:hypothetical protein
VFVLLLDRRDLAAVAEEQFVEPADLVFVLSYVLLVPGNLFDYLLQFSTLAIPPALLADPAEGLFLLFNEKIQPLDLIVFIFHRPNLPISVEFFFQVSVLVGQIFDLLDLIFEYIIQSFYFSSDNCDFVLVTYYPLIFLSRSTQLVLENVDLGFILSGLLLFRPRLLLPGPLKLTLYAVNVLLEIFYLLSVLHQIDIALFDQSLLALEDSVQSAYLLTEN